MMLRTVVMGKLSSRAIPLLLGWGEALKGEDGGVWGD